MIFGPPPFMKVGNPTLFAAIQQNGLTSGLKLCLDAGDAASYGGSGQSWLDTSGNGCDFFLGTGSGSDAADPTFNGAAGGRSSSDYWSFDGGDYFTYDTTNETWMQNIHKDNAQFTIAAWVMYGALGANYRLCGTRGNTSPTGFTVNKSGSTDALIFEVQNGGSMVYNSQMSVPFTLGAWYFAAVSLNEATGANGCILQLNGTQELFDSTYSSPSAGNASQTMAIAANGNGHQPLPNGSRLAMFAVWEGVALTQANLTALFNATRGRFGV